MKKEKRIQTNISGFDNLIEGGFPECSNILISGKAGTGKTIFSTQFLYEGAKKGEVGVYFTFEEKKSDIIKQSNQFFWDLEKLEKNKKLFIVSLGINQLSKNIIEDMIEIIENTKAKRVVIDSISTLAYLIPQIENEINISKYSIKNFLYQFISSLKQENNFTTLLISQKDEKDSDNISRYLCDGIIDIEYESIGGDFSRNLIINKMRRTKNNEDIHPLEISEKGIIIHNLD